MNFQYYVNFIAVVEEPTMTAAAKKLGMAQPALSNQIRTWKRSSARSCSTERDSG